MQWTHNLNLVMQGKTWLTLVVKPVLEGSKQVTNEELKRWYEDETVIQNWRKNPLGDFMTVLAGALETESNSAERRRKEKERASKRPTLSEPPSEQTQHEFDIAPTGMTGIIPPHIASSSSSMSRSTPDPLPAQHKRTASAATTASYGASSTESPPQSIDKPEPHVQELQNVFVRLIMKAIWGGGVPIPWAQGRKMWLDYTPYHSRW